MSSAYDIYQTPLNSRYASNEMKALFSARSRHSTWRQLWIWLAESEKELGIASITDEALAQMTAHATVTDAGFARAADIERTRKHDVMAHVHAYAEEAPAAAGVIHLGATSCFVTDNAELILMRRAMGLLLPKLAKAIHNLARFAVEHKALPTLGYTHYQPAQLVTVGKRAASWVQDLVMDLEAIEAAREGLLFRGAQGTTGTQASFLEIFAGDGSRVDRLNELLCEKAGFPRCYDISTQTYSRKVDLAVANAVCALGSTVQRIASDIRHLAHEKELEEPFGKDQIGSSAMAYKRNPMLSERLCSLGRKLSTLPANFAKTYETQWLERTLDDSAIRRIDIPEAFLLADAILIGLDNVTSGLVVYPERIRQHVMQELPFMATENVIMKIVSLGGSRQEAHEQIRVLSHQASDVVKKEGGSNDLIERIKRTEYFKPVWGVIDDMLRPELFIGRCPEIVERYFAPGGPVDSKLARYREYINKAVTTELAV